MLAVDTSTWIAHLQSQPGSDVQTLRQVLQSQIVFMPPVVLSELLGDPAFPDEEKVFLSGIETLDMLPQYWERAGAMRAKLARKKLRPKLPNALIAQSCIDYDVPLLTRDAGFAMFAEHCGLRIYE